MKFNKLLLVLVCMFTSYGTINAQIDINDSYPKVGEQIKDHTFTDLDNYPQKTLKISDFKGQWLIVDFWSYYCGSCVNSFPKMNELHRQFKDRVKIIMVGAYDNSKPGNKNHELTTGIFNARKKLQNLEFTVAFDSAVRRKYHLFRFPQLLVVNPQGIIVAKTTSINKQQISQLLDGQKPYFERAYSLNEESGYNLDLPVLTNGIEANGGIDTSFMFRSLLMKETEEIPFIGANELFMKNLKYNKAVRTGKLHQAGSLRQLYLMAYFGAPYWNSLVHPYRSQDVVLELKDSSNFQIEKNSLKGRYVYSLVVPQERSSEEYLKKIMQSDLNNYFNYRVSVEKRKMPVYHLVVIDSQKTARLRSKGGATKYGDAAPLSRHYGIGVRNGKFEEFVNMFRRHIPLYQHNYSQRPLIDKTGLNFNVDFSENGIDHKASLAVLNKTLIKYGLEIIEVQEEAETIVLRDN